MPALLFQPEEYRFPASLEEVLTTMAAEGDKARIIAGGTTVHELVYRRAMGDVRTLLDVTRLPLRQIAETDGIMHLGATVTFTELAAHIMAHHEPSLAIITDAIAGIRPMQIRNVGTIGGSICSSLPFFDLPAALVALDAKVTTHSVAKSARTVPIDDFFLDFFLPDLRFGEFLSEAEFPIPGRNSSGAFQKFESNSVDWALVSIGVQISVDANRFTKVRIALGGGIGRKVTRATTVESALLGAPVDDRAIATAVAHVADDVRAFSDFRGSATFRNHLLEVYIARCLTQAARRIQ